MRMAEVVNKEIDEDTSLIVVLMTVSWDHPSSAVESLKTYYCVRDWCSRNGGRQLKLIRSCWLHPNNQAGKTTDALMSVVWPHTVNSAVASADRYSLGHEVGERPVNRKSTTSQPKALLMVGMD